MTATVQRNRIYDHPEDGPILITRDGELVYWCILSTGEEKSGVLGQWVDITEEYVVHVSEAISEAVQGAVVSEQPAQVRETVDTYPSRTILTRAERDRMVQLINLVNDLSVTAIDRRESEELVELWNKIWTPNLS